MRGSRANPPVLKRFGQHFLNDQSVLEAIAAAVAPHPGDTVIEIGPGRGALTDILAARPNPLIGIEIDRALSAALRKRYADNPGVTILEKDVLQVKLSDLTSGPFVVVGNVPYYITTPIMFHVLRPPFPRHGVFLVQREVAERIVSPPGSRQYGALSANVQAMSTAEILLHVPPSAFKPPPKVDSAVLRITPRSEGLIRPDEVERFRGFVQGLFGMRRKQLGNVLRSVADISAEEASQVLVNSGVDPRARPETLSPEELVALMRAVSDRN
ncbi:MAG: 16S rRNA (adenine(1518)-N(6)/adenine(1519)-N(6))-dimethyltransferase RsmA [Gemmatimonadales bacterium]